MQKTIRDLMLKTVSIPKNIEEIILNGSRSFSITIEQLINNNENIFEYSKLPNDIKFENIQGMEILMACFWSDSKKEAYWWKLPFRRMNMIVVEDDSYRITNIEILLNEKNIYEAKYQIEKQKNDNT